MKFIIFNFIPIIAIVIATANNENLSTNTSTPKVTRDVKKSNDTKREIPKQEEQQVSTDHLTANDLKAYYNYGNDMHNQNSMSNGWTESYMNFHNNYMDNSLYEHPIVHTQTIESIKPVPIVVDKKFNYPLASPVPVRIPQIIKVPVAQPYAVHIPVPQHVAVPVFKLVAKEVEKKVPYTVERPTPYIVEKPFKVEMKKYIPVHIKKPYPVYVPIYKHVIVPDNPTVWRNGHNYKGWKMNNQNEWSFMNNYKGLNYNYEQQPLYKYIDYKTVLKHGLDSQMKNNIWKNPSIEQDGSYIDNSGWQTTSAHYMPELYENLNNDNSEGLSNYKTNSENNANNEWQLENLKSHEYQTNVNTNQFTKEDSVNQPIKPITEEEWDSSEAKFNKWKLESSNEVDWKNNANEWDTTGATEYNSVDLQKYNLLPKYEYEEWKDSNIQNKDLQIDTPSIKGWKHMLIKKTVHWKE